MLNSLGFWQLTHATVREVIFAEAFENAVVENMVNFYRGKVASGPSPAAHADNPTERRSRNPSAHAFHRHTANDAGSNTDPNVWVEGHHIGKSRGLSIITGRHFFWHNIGLGENKRYA